MSLPWAPLADQHLAELIVRRDSRDFLSYSDGIALEVRVIDPAAYPTVEALIFAAKAEEVPGRVVLVAGTVPLNWRSELRCAMVSFMDVSGVVELNWPRIRVSARRFTTSVQRERSPISLQKGHARIIQELLIATTQGGSPTIGEIAFGAGANPATASRAISQLAEQGLIAKVRDQKNVAALVKDRIALAERLAERTAWPHSEVLHGYLWGRSVWEVADKLSKAASQRGVGIAVTGRTGAAFLGVLSTSSPSTVRCWVDTGEANLEETAGVLGIEPAPESEANVTISGDPWRIGTHRRRSINFDEWSATISHPLRVWCDLHSEPRGTEYAAQLWGVIHRGG